MKNKIYKVNDIFLSIQCEGHWAGTPMIFVRFSGCNLKCSFCDTQHEKHVEMTLEEIQEKVASYNCKRVCFTGGEPLLQLDTMLISRMILIHKMQCHIETNGTIPSMTLSKLWITVSPKTPEFIDGNELKLIWNGQTKEQLDWYLHRNFKYFYLQPEYNYLSIPILSPLHEQRFNNLFTILKEEPRWRLSIQLQKILQIQ